jgi:hypothetical protein
LEPGKRDKKSEKRHQTLMFARPRAKTFSSLPWLEALSTRSRILRPLKDLSQRFRYSKKIVEFIHAV